jgi:SRSO17 transposase
MTRRLPCPPAPGPLEEYAAQFDDLFGYLSQRRNFRTYLEGLLLPRDRNKTLTALVGTEPVIGAQAAPVQQLQFFVSESTWKAEVVNARRLELLVSDPATAPHENGVLVIDDTGDRKDGTKTAHVARQYLGSVGKIDNGIVAVSSLWADERVYYPLHVQPYTPAERLPLGKKDPAFRTKPQIALELVDAALSAGFSFRAIVSDCIYGENATFEAALSAASLPYVLGLKPSKGIWAPADAAHTPEEAARELHWGGPEAPGDWTRVVRHFRDGHQEIWWAADLAFGPYGPDKPRRVVVATTDPATLPDLTTWYLAANLPRPGSPQADDWPVPAADLAEVVRIYGLRNWIEQGYKQIKNEMGWADFMVRSDQAIRRHWCLVCCAFSFIWRSWFNNQTQASAPDVEAKDMAPMEALSAEPDITEDGPVAEPATGLGENTEQAGRAGYAGTIGSSRIVAGSPARGQGLAGSVGSYLALVERVVQRAPASGAASAARFGWQRSPTQPISPMLTKYR